ASIGDFLVAETGITEREEAEEIVSYLFSLGCNHLSYQNSLVYKLGERVAGLVIYYDGSEETHLLTSAAKQLRRLHNDPSITLKREAKDDELYINILSVNPHFRGKGIGTALLKVVE